ncbi:MAG: hypothetical protein KAV87_32465 [Desulfobacteraceae bacterium]|nr:hypothetical protein [Desulfobacteraceae bacterium]
METFTESKDFIENPHYLQQRQTSLVALDIDTIDAPIVDIVKSFQNLTCCFTLQSCYGHFIHAGQQDRNSTERLPISDCVAPVMYRIAYVAFCLENSTKGKELFEDLRAIPAAEPGYIQFGSAEWFWARQANSYVLQVEPERFKDKDQATIDYQEALHVQEVRDNFFSKLKRLLHEQQRGIQKKGNV